MRAFTTKSKTSRILFITLSAVFWTALWALAALLIDNELMLPSPARTVARLCELIGTLAFWQAAGWSLLRILFGFAAGVLAGTLLAIPTSRR